MKLPYAKSDLEKILAELTGFSNPRESHKWAKFEVYNGKPEPDTFYCDERKKFLDRVHSLNGHISKVNLYLEKNKHMQAERHLSIEVKKPVIIIEYEGSVISSQFRMLMDSYRPQKTRHETASVGILPPEYQ